MLCALINDYKVVAVEELTEEEYVQLSYTHQNIIDITNITPAPLVGWTWTVLTFQPPLNWDQVELVASTVYDPVANFCWKLQRRFIAENITWGITQQGKTRAVGDFMEQIEKWFKRNSLKEVIEELTLSIARIDADPSIEQNLSPFITKSRLQQYRLSILQYLGLA